MRIFNNVGGYISKWVHCRSGSERLFLHGSLCDLALSLSFKKSYYGIKWESRAANIMIGHWINHRNHPDSTEACRITCLCEPAVEKSPN